jgi:DNA-binding response OmpR family regulator
LFVGNRAAGGDAGRGSPLHPSERHMESTGFVPAAWPPIGPRRAPQDRAASPGDWHLACGSGRFDPVRRVLVADAHRVRLSPRETEILFQVLKCAPGGAAVADVIREVWGHDGEQNRDAYRQALRTLRKKLQAAALGMRVVTVHVDRCSYLVPAVE